MMKLTSLSRFTLVASLMLAGAVTRADDIDIYTGATKGGVPNLLIILDNSGYTDASATFTCPIAGVVNDPGTSFGFEQCGLYSAVSSITADPTLNGNLNLGLMYFPAGPNSGQLSQYGGQFVMPKASLTPGPLPLMDGPPSSGTGIQTMLTRIKSLSLATDKANNSQISQAMQEAWAFYEGQTGLSGTNYKNVMSQDSCTKDFVLFITLATTNSKPAKATSELSGTTLGAIEYPSAPTTLPTQLALPSWTSPVADSKGAYEKASGAYQGSYADEWAQFMYTGTLPNQTTATYRPSITTFTIILSDGTNPDYEQLMVNMAKQGGGAAYVVKLGDTTALASALGRVLHEVQAVNSVFAAPVLPVSANTQGTYLNQVYMGMFRPDSQANPRWLGNLKQYQFGVYQPDATTPPQLFLADASWGTGTNGAYPAGYSANPALDGGTTGFISTTAVSFWTSKDSTLQSLPDSKGGFWANSYKVGYDSADGEVVEKGGVSQQLRLKYLTDTYPSSSTVTTDTSARNVYTCLGTTCNSTTKPALSTMPFSVGNTALTASTLGITSSTITAPGLINWVRGDDTYAPATGATNVAAESAAPPDPSITIRGSVHGDVLHSRPAVINYGGSTGVVVFYGANDGMFRAINGNQPPATNVSPQPQGFCTVSSTCAIPAKDAKGKSINVPPGGEIWSFVPSEFYTGLQRLYQNSPVLNLGGSTATGAAPKTYFFDGAPSVYQNSSTGTAYIFLSARRGGRLIYALDVSDPTNPKFMWKHDGSKESQFSELGQTWSQPKVAMIKGNTNPVLIFGAGYDTNEDTEPHSAADAVGRGIFILDAVTGALLWEAGPNGATSCSSSPCQLQVSGMAYATPADITLVDRNYDGLIDRLYAADLGGNIWRVDLESSTGAADVSNWRVTQIAALGGTGTTKRKFFFPPDFVPTKSYDVLLDTSGDREHPLQTQTATLNIVNRFYMIKDTNPTHIDSSTLAANIMPAVHDDADNTSLTAAVPSLFQVTSTTPYGGSLNGFYFTLTGKGEKGVNAPTTVGGTTYFGTNQPLASDGTVCQADLGKAISYSINFLTGKESSTEIKGGGLLPSPVFGIVTVNVAGKPIQEPFLIGGGGGMDRDSKSGLGAQKPDIPIKKTRQRTYWYRESDR